MKDTFTLADLANFKLPEQGASAPAPEAESQSAAPTETQATESSAAEPAPSDETVETSSEETLRRRHDSAIAVDESTTEAAAVPEGENQKGKKTAREFINELADERDALRRFNEYLLAREQPTPQAETTVAQAAPAVETVPTLEGSGFDVAKYERVYEGLYGEADRGGKDTGRSTKQQRRLLWRHSTRVWRHMQRRIRARGEGAWQPKLTAAGERCSRSSGGV